MADKREQIEAIASAAIRKSGLNSVSFRTLADEVGVKSSSVHYHFPTKLDLAQSVVGVYTEDFGEAVVNSFKAHQLLDFAATKGLQHPLKMALFKAHFTDARDVSDAKTLLDIAAETGLDRTEAETALSTEAHANAVRAQEQVWAQNGISGVPTMIFNEKYLVTGAQGPQNYAQMLTKARAEAAKA